MKKQKTILFIISLIVMMLAVISFLLFWGESEDLPISVEVEMEGETEIIACWKQEDDYYVFLPSYVQPDQVRIILNTEMPVYVGGVMLEDGMTCAGFGFNVAYELFCQTWNGSKDKTITFMHSANVATMYVDTQSGSMEFIHEKKGNEETGTLQLYTAEGVVNYAGDIAKLSGRGNATWTDFEKKSYSLNLTAEADLLGMGAAQRWILLANAGDASHLRNKIVYDFAHDVGLAYSPDSQWVDLYLNGEYAGLYLLCERNEVHPERVNVDSNDSFLVSLELEERLVAQNYPHVITQAGQALRIHYPQEVSTAFMADLSSQWQSIENALLAQNGIDPITGKNWQELIDMDSWAKKYLIEELFGSIDACLISQFFYVDGSEGSDKTYAGPVWDFDNALGNRLCWELVNPESFHANQFRERDGHTTPWFFALYQKKEFFAYVIEMYRAQFLPILENEMIVHIREYAELVAQASAMNQVRWESETGDFREEIEYIINYMNRRKDFLTDAWCNNTEYCYVYADYGHDCCYAVLPGECFTDAYVFEAQEYATFLGWYYTDTDEPFDPTRPITEDIHIYAKWQPKESNKLNQVIKLLPLGVIAILGIVLVLVDIRRMKRSR